MFQKRYEIPLVENQNGESFRTNRRGVSPLCAPTANKNRQILNQSARRCTGAASIIVLSCVCVWENAGKSKEKRFSRTEKPHTGSRVHVFRWARAINPITRVIYFARSLLLVCVFIVLYLVRYSLWNFVLNVYYISINSREYFRDKSSKTPDKIIGRNKASRHWLNFVHRTRRLVFQWKRSLKKSGLRKSKVFQTSFEENRFTCTGISTQERRKFGGETDDVEKNVFFRAI